jgi:hypothetical protein
MRSIARYATNGPAGSTFRGWRLVGAGRNPPARPLSAFPSGADWRSGGVANEEKGSVKTEEAILVVRVFFFGGSKER